MKNKKYFFCYSYNLKKFISNNGVRYEFAGNNPNNGKPYWGYLKDEKLNSLLSKWNEQYETP